MTDKKRDATKHADSEEVKAAKPEPTAPEPAAVATDEIEPKAEAYFLTIALDDGKRLQERRGQSLASLQSEAAAFAHDGINWEESGVWTHYPPHRIAKVTITVAST